MVTCYMRKIYDKNKVDVINIYYTGVMQSDWEKLVM